MLCLEAGSQISALTNICFGLSVFFSKDLLDKKKKYREVYKRVVTKKDKKDLNMITEIKML